MTRGLSHETIDKKLPVECALASAKCTEWSSAAELQKELVVGRGA